MLKFHGTEIPCKDIASVTGLTESQVKEIEQLLGFPISSQLREWLTLFGESMIGPGGLSVLPAGHESMGVIARTQMHSEWLEQGWVPLGGDWCGGYYVVATLGEPGLPEPVYFVDFSEDSGGATYIASSSPAFLWSCF